MTPRTGGDAPDQRQCAEYVCPKCGVRYETGGAGPCCWEPLERVRPAEDVARLFHDTYERLAPFYGYETRKESAVAWEDVPEQNRLLMIETCRYVLSHLRLNDGREPLGWCEVCDDWTYEPCTHIDGRGDGDNA